MPWYGKKEVLLKQENSKTKKAIRIFATSAVFEFFVHKLLCCNLFTWGRSGFDGDFEPWEAGRCGHILKSSILNINANRNLAIAA